jgi:LuxR family transcriptional regulator, maltose regulon positive regulatory protein
MVDNRIPITSTKLLVPRRREDTLTRQRLLDLLFELLDMRLVIVAAPAGYGKTTLLADLVHTAQMPTSWLSLDPLDQDLQRFIAHLIAAIHTSFPDFGKASSAALQNMNLDQTSFDSLVAQIANDLYENVHEHFAIVLDDYNLVEESKYIPNFINQLIQKVDENCHFIIASRTLLNLPDMPLLVARSQVGGLSFEELAFQPDEIQTLWLSNFHLTLSESEAAELAKETEGWITGLLLTRQTAGGRLSDRVRVARVAGVGLYEYLAQQVLERQPVEIQQFLLQTSLLEEFDSELCEEVIGQTLGVEMDWVDLTECVLRANLFIQPVGDERIYLRYHHLFRDFLQNRMLRDHPVEAEKIQLHLADVCAQHGEWERSYAIYQRTGKTDEIARLVERAGPTMVARGRLSTLSEWIEALPETYRGRPGVVSLDATVLSVRGRLEEAIFGFDRAIQAFGQVENWFEMALALVRRSSANRFLGRLDPSIADAEEAVRILERMPVGVSVQPAQEKRDADVGFTANGIRADAFMCLGIGMYYQGNPSTGFDWFTKAYQIYAALEDGESMAKALMQMGMISKAMGRYAEADKTYTRALEFYQSSGNLVWQANVLNNLGVLQQLRGNIDGAASSFEKSIQYARIAGYSRLESYALTSLGDLFRDLDAFEEAQEAFHRARPIALRMNDRFLIFYLDMTEALLAGATGQANKAQRLMDLAWSAAEKSGSRYQQNLCRLERACDAIGRRVFRDALEDLQECIGYFEKEGYRSQALRAHFYLAVVYRTLAERNEALAHLDLTYRALMDQGNENLIAATGRQLRSHLEVMQTDPDFEQQAVVILRQVDAFERRIPNLRRQLRRQSQTVPFGPPKVIIHTLGRIQVKINGKAITGADWLTQTARDLFLLIVAHPEGMTKEEIGLILWSDSSPTELKMRFKNVIYRLRRATGKDTILFDGELYRFDRSLDYEEDADAFTREIEQADKEKKTEQKIYHLRAAMRYYKGDFLPDLAEDWVMQRREQLKRAYIEHLLQLASLELEQRSFEQALNCTQRLLTEDNCLEEAHRLAMLIYAATGNRAGVMRQYETCSKALAEEFDAQPSIQTQELYHTLTH